MYNSKLINQVREGKAAIEDKEEWNIQMEDFSKLSKYIWPECEPFVGGYNYCFQSKEGPYWGYSDELPEGMTAIPFADFLKDEENELAKNGYVGTKQKLFNYMAQEHGVNLLDSDMNEIIRICESKPDLEAERRRFWCDVTLANYSNNVSYDKGQIFEIADATLAAFDERFGGK